MALTEGPRHLVHGSLVAATTPAAADYDPVEVRMVRDATGCTYHERRPRMVEGKAGETLIVSHNLAVLWAASGRCVLFSVEEPAPIEAASAPATELPQEPEPEPQPSAPSPQKPPRKTRRRRGR